MKKRWLGLAGLACVACCTVPLLMVGATSVGVGVVAAVSLDQWICGALLAAMAVGAVVLFRKRRSLACATTGASSCAAGCGCQTQNTK